MSAVGQHERNEGHREEDLHDTHGALAFDGTQLARTSASQLVSILQLAQEARGAIHHVMRKWRTSRMMMNATHPCVQHLQSSDLGSPGSRTLV